MQSPAELGKKYAKVSVDNFLAHTIRQIEGDIFRRARLRKSKDVNFRIQTRISKHVSRKSLCNFFHDGCTIYLPSGSKENDFLDARIWLAHELGHIVAYIPYFSGETSDEPPRDGNYSVNEEADAWEFALALLWNKSEFHKLTSYKPFIYDNFDEITSPIIRLVREHGGDSVKAELKRRNFSQNL
ncbi:hypothetical protein [Desulfovibrio sp. ZJ369]|uniref:hypothetical protein n=1 Tax=Desulfovibrio sp. ZJ369 TaxID=2709793 RepID=UPI0013ECEBD3|nr:hypothetical protein [Desulfovibrio sp. ZJ369]